MARTILKILNGVYEFLIGIILLVGIAFSVYSIWDNFQVYRSAENVQNQIRQLKPEQQEDDSLNFNDLISLNSEFVGWITVNGTNIDYPVLQGKNNLDYMNKDVYGEFSLAGSIFLDSRNSNDFSDNYSLIYGHNMEEHLMFGDLALFKDKQFFTENTQATLMIPNQVMDMNVVAIIQVSAGTEEIFNPTVWEDNLDGFGEYLKKNSIWYHSDMVELLISKPNSVEIVALATCSDGNTNDRTVLILIKEKPETEVSSNDIHRDNVHNDETNSSDDDKDSINTSDDSNNDDKDSINTSNDTNNNNGNNNNINDGNLIDNDNNIDDVMGDGCKPTGDTQNPEFWYFVIVGVVLFIITFETVERLISRRRKS